MCECGFCLYERVLETAADCRGKRQASIRVNAICEFRCLIDPSGPQSLFSISIYHHLSSQDHISVSPSPPLLPCSQVFHTLCGSALSFTPLLVLECPQKNKKKKQLTLRMSCRGHVKQVKAIKRDFSGFYYLVWGKTSGEWKDADVLPANHQSMQLQRSGESTSSCGSLLSCL